MITLIKNPHPPQKAPTPAEKAQAAPVAQCCAKISRSVAGCHD